MASRFSRNFKKILILILVIGGAWAWTHFTNVEETIIIDGKQMTVIDGDSFKDAVSEYRIYGIDAPEYRQFCTDARGRDWPCGKSARTALDTVLRQGQHSCDVHARDQYGRIIVTCISGDRDLGAHLVERGHAISSENFDYAVYGNEEAQAEKAKRGIWQGSFVKPANWRAQHPRR